MMNPSTIAAVYKTGNSLWSKYKDQRDKRSLADFDELELAAARASEGAPKSALPEARREAGAITQAAHNRLERALEDFNKRRNEFADEASDRFEDVKKDAAKRTKKLRKQASKRADELSKKGKKAQKQAEKRANKAKKEATKRAKKAEREAKRKQGGNKFWPIAITLTVLSAIAGAVYYFFRNDEKPSSTPPRVEEFSRPDTKKGEESKLVYTSSSEDDKKDTAAEQAGDDHTVIEENEPTKPESDMVEEGVVERDEELLNSIDEQLEALRGEDVDIAPSDDSTRVTDDHANEGKHRLHSDDKE
ncbi:MAG: hypothetical protein SPJ78_05505 [Corynebacterium camporealensis]|uniref:hypothetical protein n=1 Tax=Corynebacterium camporealensis TaxID=161896 RepID=UPI002A913569|nr:hypothetical protein [Corynebacterium camporealensis]MDY5840156.1 hypothetical protein [Corynebacterium camporealensis]